MASNSPNLKVGVTADTSQFKKGMQDSKAALRDFNNTGKDLLGKFGDAVGVNFGKVGQLSNSVKGLGVSLSKSGNEGVAAFGKMVTAAGGAASAIAAIGLGAAVAAFKLLSAEAENFKQTIEGANLELQTTAWVDTYKQAMHDFNSEMGKSIAQIENDWKRAFTRIWANAQGGAVRFISLFKENGGGVKGFVNALYDASEQTQAAAAQASESASQAMVLQNKLNNLIQLQKYDTMKVASLDAEIAKYKRMAVDSDLSASERLQANEKAAELIRQKYDLQLGLQRKIAVIMHEIKDLTNSTQAEVDAAYAASQKVFSLEQRQEEELASLERRQKSLTREVAAEVTARREAAAAAKAQAEAIAADRASLAGMGLKSIDTAGAQALMGGATTSQQGNSRLDVGGEVERVYKDVLDLSDAINTALNDSLTSLAEAMGELVGNLATGQEAWGSFKNAALAAFGDMAVNIGKLALATGIAILGIRQGLMSLNPYAAIAAGAALIALGVAVKVGMANIANGSGSSGAASVASATGSSNRSSVSNYETNEIEVKVTGTLQASGSQLLAVIDNENKRTNHTT